MIETMATTFVGLVSSPYLMGLILLAIPLGMFFGAVPGLGGKLGIALMIPFVFGMDMVPGGGVPAGDALGGPHRRADPL